MQNIARPVNGVGDNSETTARAKYCTTYERNREKSTKEPVQNIARPVSKAGGADEAITRAKYCTTHEQSRRKPAKQPPVQNIARPMSRAGKAGGTIPVQNIARLASGAKKRRSKRLRKILHDLRAERKNDVANACAKHCTIHERERQRNKLLCKILHAR